MKLDRFEARCGCPPDPVQKRSILPEEAEIGRKPVLSCVVHLYGPKTREGSHSVTHGT